MVVGDLLGMLGLRESIAAVVIFVAFLFRYRRWQSLGAAFVGAISTGATIAIVVIGFVVFLVAAGYWDPPLGEMLGDGIGFVRMLWDLGLEWVFQRLVDLIEGAAE